MSTDEQRPYVPLRELVGDLTAAPLPEGTTAEAIFMMVKLDDDSWCIRSIGDDFNRAEFFLELTAYVHALTTSTAEEWVEDPDKPV